MNRIRIFISSVQREFAVERKALRDFLRGDPLLHRFFDGFVVTIRRKPELAFKAVGGITGEVEKLLTVLVGEMKRTEIQKTLALRHEDYFREAYLIPALTAGAIEMTIPGKPKSSKQQYRLTPKGRALVAKRAKEGDVGGK